jgi:hypothetical protein
LGGKMTKYNNTIDLVCCLILFMIGFGSASAAQVQQSNGNSAHGGFAGQGQFTVGAMTSAVGDYEHPNELKWAPLACPPGEYVVGLVVRQGGWTSQVAVECAAPSAKGTWASPPVAGGAAGGEYGTHNARLMCPKDHWVAGLGGLTVHVGHAEGLIERLFLADPVVSCSAPDATGFTTVRDLQFQREKGSPLDLAPARYEESQTQYCPAGTFSMGAEAAVEPEHHPDIKAVRLSCSQIRSVQP